MRIPRDVDGAELAKSLEAFDYHITRQTGSHIRLTYYPEAQTSESWHSE